MRRSKLHAAGRGSRPLRARSALAGAALAALAALASFGCGTRDTVIARIGPRVITRSDFDVAAAANWTQYQDPPQQARRRLLDDLIKRDLLLMIADTRGLSNNALTRTYRQHVEEQVLSGALAAQLTPQNVPVTDAEIAEFYEWNKITAHLEVMYSPDRALIDAGLARLRAGRPFAEVAQEVTPIGLLPPGGDLGEVTVGTLVDPLDEFAREAPVGEIVGPVEGAGEGWFVGRVLSRRLVPPDAPLEARRGMLVNVLRQRKLRMGAARAYLSLRDQYHIAVEAGGPEALYSYLNGGALDSIRSAPSAVDSLSVLARCTDARGRALTYTLADAMVDLSRNDRERPDRSGTPAIRLWIGQQVVQRVLIMEAKRRGLDRDPQMAKRIEENVNNGLLETIYTDEVAGAVRLDPDDVRRVYEQQSAQFQRLDAARVQSLTLADSAVAAELTRHGSHAGSLLEAARMMGLADRVIEQRVTFPNADPLWQALQPNLLTMSRGEWAGPWRVKSGWRVLELLEKETRPQDFEQLTDATRQGLQQLALDMKRDQRLTFVADSMRRLARPFEIRERELDAIPWPPLAAR